MSLQEKSLFMAMELSNKKWKLAFGKGAGSGTGVLRPGMSWNWCGR